MHVGDVLMAAEPETTILTIRPPDEAFIAASDKTVIITAMETSQILGLRQIEGLDKHFPLFGASDDAQRDGTIAANHAAAAIILQWSSVGLKHS